MDVSDEPFTSDSVRLCFVNTQNVTHLHETSHMSAEFVFR